MEHIGLSKFITGNPQTRMSRTKSTRCGKCGFKIRGKLHDEGNHHNSGSNKTYSPPKKW